MPAAAGRRRCSACAERSSIAPSARATRQIVLRLARFRGQHRRLARPATGSRTDMPPRTQRGSDQSARSRHRCSQREAIPQPRVLKGFSFRRTGFAQQLASVKNHEPLLTPPRSPRSELLQVIEFHRLFLLIIFSSKCNQAPAGAIRAAPSPRHPQTYPQIVWITSKGYRCEPLSCNYSIRSQIWPNPRSPGRSIPR